MPFKTTHFLYYITKQTEAHNLDNISRTNAYFDYFQNYPEVKWAFLASIVSRNAGWNMTDLTLPLFTNVLNERQRWHLFRTYERANWLIFSDAYKQLMVYALSKHYNKPLFFLFNKLGVSAFMQGEWQYFWKSRNETRLMISFIIHEQNLIEHAVLHDPYYKKNVFQKIPYWLQNTLRLNAVLVPTKKGDLYGKYMKGFTNVSKRIRIGKEIAALIFHPDLFEVVCDFCTTVPPTGSRYEYEQFLNKNVPYAFPLRWIVPSLNHQKEEKYDWFTHTQINPEWGRPIILNNYKKIGDNFYFKRWFLHTYGNLKSALKIKKDNINRH